MEPPDDIEVKAFPSKYMYISIIYIYIYMLTPPAPTQVFYKIKKKTYAHIFNIKLN